MFLSIVGARSAEQYGITRGQNLLTPTSYGFSIKTYKIDVNGKYKIYRNMKLSKVNSTARLCGGIYSCMSRV